MKTERRSVIKKIVGSVVGLAGLGLAANAKTFSSEEKEAMNVTSFQEAPLFSGSTKFGNLVFIAGKGAHVAPFEIKAHTDIVLKELEQENSRLKRVVADFALDNAILKEAARGNS